MGINNKFQLPNNNPAAMVNQGVVNKFVKTLQQAGGAQQGRSYGPRNFNIQRFYSNGTFIVPAGVTILNCIAVGGGGGGGGSESTTSGAPPGFGGGSNMISFSFQCNPGDSIGVTIGAGGAGGAVGYDGSVGAPTYLGFPGGNYFGAGGGSNGLYGGQTLGPIPGYSQPFYSDFSSSSTQYPQSAFDIPPAIGIISSTVQPPASVVWDFYQDNTIGQGGSGGDSTQSGYAGTAGAIYLSWS